MSPAHSSTAPPGGLSARDAERVANARMRSQGIHGPGFPAPVDAVRWLGAMQAQDLPGAKWSVGLRTTGATVSTVDAALNSGRIVRAWPMRGTLHLVAAEDLGWMLSLTAARMVASARTRYAQLGLDDEVFALARRIAEAELSGNRSLSRRELLAAWDAGGIATTGRGSHLIGHLAMTGVLCLGPVDDPDQGSGQTTDGDLPAQTGASGQRIVLAGEWITHSRALEGDAALGEWLTRYVHSHGPATLRDFLHWTKLTVKDGKRALEVAGDAVVTVGVGGTDYLCSPHIADTLDDPPDRAAIDLLPGFDEVVLGYRDRTAALAEHHAERIVPGGNGMFMPTVVRGARVIGTWRRRTTSGLAVEASVFPGVRSPAARAVRTAAQRYADYLGRPLLTCEVRAD